MAAGSESSDKLIAAPGATGRYKTVLLLGAPGAGKGTQGQIIKSIPGFFHFSQGDVFRRLDINSQLGKVFFEYSSRGELVPDRWVIALWSANIGAYATLGDFKPHRQLLVLDGIPRTRNQAKLMEEHIDVLKVVHLMCKDRKAMVDRLRKRAIKENRFDDADEKVILKRLQVYEEETLPIVSFYPKDRVVEVDSLGSPAHVLASILAELAPLQDKHYSGVAM